MNVKRLIGGQMNKVKSLNDQVRLLCQTAFDVVLSRGREGLFDLVQARKELEPKLRGAVDEGVRSAQDLLDQLNQLLADRAIPSFRKAGVTQKRLEEKTGGLRANGADSSLGGVAAPGNMAAAAIASGTKAKLAGSDAKKTQNETPPQKTRVRTPALVATSNNGQKPAVAADAKPVKASAAKASRTKAKAKPKVKTKETAAARSSEAATAKGSKKSPTAGKK